MINHDWLLGFLVFASHRNFTRAARELHISQPALHTQIRKLSESLGVPLYRKQGRELHLTPAGKRVLAFAREIHERSSALQDELATRAHRMPLVLAAGQGAFLYLLGDAIKAYHSGGNAPLQLLTLDRDATVEAVRTGAAHLGVTALDAIPHGVDAEVLAVVEQNLVVPAGHALARRGAARLKDLEGVPLILPPADRPHRTSITAALNSAGVTADVAVEANGWELMLHFVRIGLGVTIVNGCCRIPSGTVAFPLAELPAVRYQILSRAGARLSPAAKTLRDRMRSRRSP